MYGLSKRLPSGAFACDMCKSEYYYKKRFLFHTFEFPPHCPSKERIICEKCAVREGGRKFKEIFDKGEEYEFLKEERELGLEGLEERRESLGMQTQAQVRDLMSQEEKRM